MRNLVAKKLRKEAGKQSSTSNRLTYEYSKKEHMRAEVSPKLKRSKRQMRIGRTLKTISTINQPGVRRRKASTFKAARLKA